jgi:hypothetical protein
LRQRVDERASVDDARERLIALAQRAAQRRAAAANVAAAGAQRAFPEQAVARQ